MSVAPYYQVVIDLFDCHAFFPIIYLFCYANSYSVRSCPHSLVRSLGRILTAKKKISLPKKPIIPLISYVKCLFNIFVGSRAKRVDNSMGSIASPMSVSPEKSSRHRVLRLPCVLFDDPRILHKFI